MIDAIFPPNVTFFEELVAGADSTMDLHLLLDSPGGDGETAMVQEARSALERSEDLVREALASNKDRAPGEVDRIAAALKETLIDLPRNHGAVFGADDARRVGLPVIEVDPNSVQWRLIWMLWSKYVVMGAFRDVSVYEGRLASQVLR